MNLVCPHCSQKVFQRRNKEGPNFCTECRRLFFLAPDREVPPWILGVVVVLIGNWQIIVNTNRMLGA
jgi:hypothetical protein